LRSCEGWDDNREGGGGTIDESERRFPSNERRIAEMLQSEGKHVKSLAPRNNPSRRRFADALVNGIKTEFKTARPGADSATIRNEINNSIRGDGQARHMIIDARGSGLTEAEATRGLARTIKITRGKIDSVRIIGHGFDITSTDFQ